MDRQRGDVVDVRFTKWGGRRHWEFPVTYLGRDEHGHWGGAPAGTRLARPGNAFTSAFDWVTLLPHDAPWAASFYASPDQPVELYVDVTTPATWSGPRVTLVDLDLDVVRMRDGTLVLADEDEFDAHRVELGYPDDVVALARRSAADLMAAVGSRVEPFGDAGTGWLARLSEQGATA